MRRARPTRARIARAVALSAAIAALALSLRASSLLLPFAALAAGALATPFLEWTPVPDRLVRVLPRVHGLLLLIVALLAWSSRTLGVLVLDPAVVPSAGGLLVVPVALAFALAPAAFPSGRTLVPATIGLLALAGLDPSPSGYGSSALPFLRGADHSSFAEVYLALAVVALASLWTAALVESGPRWHRREAVWVGLTAVLAVSLAATGIVGLPLLQPRVERAFAEALDAGTTGLSGESTLGDFAELSASRRRVLDLETSAADAGPWLLRSEVFTAFDGRRWTNARRRDLPGPSAPRPRPSPSVRSSPTRGRGSRDRAPSDRRHRAHLELRFVQTDVSSWPLLLPRGVTAVTADASFLEVDRFGTFRRPAGVPVSLYGAVLPTASVPAVTPPPSEDELAESLALPDRVDERVRALARSLAPSDAPPRDRLAATVAHLHAGYRYTLAPGPLPHRGRPRRVPVREEGGLLRVLRERGRRPPAPAGCPGAFREGPQRRAADRPGGRPPRGPRVRRPRVGRGVSARRGMGRGRPHATRFPPGRPRPAELPGAGAPARAGGARGRLGLPDRQGSPRSPAPARPGRPSVPRADRPRASRLDGGRSPADRSPPRPVPAAATAGGRAGGRDARPRGAGGPRARARAPLARGGAAPACRGGGSSSTPGPSPTPRASFSCRPITGPVSAAKRRRRTSSTASATPWKPEPPPVFPNPRGPACVDTCEAEETT